MRPGGERRGNAKDRQRRRVWLLATFDPELGADRARCALQLSPVCPGVVTLATLTVDRIVPGGSYAHENIQPACAPCQNRQGALITWERRQQWREWRAEADAMGIDWDGSL